MGIMLPPEPGTNNTPARGWKALDLHPADVAPLLPRFHAKYEAGGPDECWPWLGSRTPAGYGHLKGAPGVSPLGAHRVAWVAATGQALTNSLTIDHLCNNPSCVNPTHLEPVTMAENIRRMTERRRQTPGGARRYKGGRRRAPARPIVDEADRQQRQRERALAYYYENRDRILAERRAVPRDSRRANCPECGVELRRDGLRRHSKRAHGAR